MATNGAADGGRARPWRLRSGAGLAALGLFLVACGRPVDPEQARLELVQSQLRRSYESQLTSMRPAHVFVTYPGTIGSMSDFKRHELDVVKSVLTEKGMAFKVVDRGQVLETLTVHKRNPIEVHAYRVPDDVAAKCRGGTVLFLNLDVRGGLETARHPSTPKDLRVMVWDDPFRETDRRASDS